MTLADAVTLIQNDHFKKLQHLQQWADLGCGSGLFSKALLQLLPSSSVVYAIDKQPQSFRESNILFHQLDFINDELPFDFLDGILMANALHYVKDKPALISKLKRHIKTNAAFVVVEYDTEKSNQWVPFPINFISLQQLFVKEGFEFVEKINERPSRYNSGKMYSAHIHNR